MKGESAPSILDYMVLTDRKMKVFKVDGNVEFVDGNVEFSVREWARLCEWVHRELHRQRCNSIEPLMSLVEYVIEERNLEKEECSQSVFKRDEWFTILSWILTEVWRDDESFRILYDLVKFVIAWCDVN